MTISSDKNNNNVHDRFERGRAVAIGIASVVYAGVIAAATLMFITFVLDAFPATAYFSRFVMSLAGVLIGGSMVAFPFALHNWAVHGWHRKITAGLYYGEIFLIGVNTIVAFAHLLAKNAGRPAPDWVILYEPFSIFAIVYTLFAWGTVFLLDPVAQAKDKEVAAMQDFKSRIAQKKKEFLDSVEGEDVIAEAAGIEIMDEFNPANHKRVRRHFGSGGMWDCQHCGTRNLAVAGACRACGAPRTSSLPTPPATPALPPAGYDPLKDPRVLEALQRAAQNANTANANANTSGNSNGASANANP
jgi:hypothetical protein